MSTFSISDLVAIIGGRVSGSQFGLITGYKADSRKVCNGDVFFCIDGQRSATQFAPEAASKGAVAIVSDTQAPAGFKCSWIQVDSPLESLHLLASTKRRKNWSQVIAITGSVGKTSVKDMTVSILKQKNSVAFSPGNSNTEIGLPLAICNADEYTDVFVAEMGMRAKGEIDLLCQITEPTMAAITKIAEAHLGMLGTIEDIADAKAEILRALSGDGDAIIPADSLFVDYLEAQTKANITHFGLSPCDVWASDIANHESGTSFKLRIDNERFSINLPYIGDHMVHNATCAAAIAQRYGAKAEEIVAGLESVSISTMRSQLVRGIGGFRIIADCYNANPTSMKAAINAVADMETVGRKIALLGEMGELGPSSDVLHEEVASYAEKSDLEVFGYETSKYGTQRLERSQIADFVSQFRPNDVVLIKGSRSVGMESVVSAMRDSDL